MISALSNTLPQDLSQPAAVCHEAQPGTAGVDELYAQYGQRIFRFLLANCRDRDLALSLTQDTFLRAWRAQDRESRFRGDSSPITWLTHIALNLLRDHTRTDRFRFWKKASAEAVEAQDLQSRLASGAPSAEKSLIAQQGVAAVAAALPTLSAKQRSVFLLRFVEEFELAEIASITGMPLPTVKTHLYRALAAVRARVSPPEAK